MNMLTAINGSRHLFLDLDDVESMHNVVQTVCEATKHPDNPVLPLGAEDEWDSCQASPWASRTVIYDDEERIFKAWYEGGRGADVPREQDPFWITTGYAISEDGIHWQKPRLGHIEYHGSRDNNICSLGTGCVAKDVREPDAAKRYKMIVKGPWAPLEGYPHGGPKLRICYSPDGIHWTEGPYLSDSLPDLILNDVVALLCDDQDPDPQRRIKIAWQIKHPPRKPGPPEVRAKSMGFGPDIEHLVASADNPVISPDDGLEDEIHFLMLGAYEGMYVMPYEYGWYAPNDTGVYGSYFGDIRLAVSRDGEHFRRVQPHQKTIARGARGEWDDGFIVIADKPVIKDDTIYLYYSGNGEQWLEWPPENMSDPSRLYVLPTSQMGVATLRRDGYTCLETTDRETPGHVTTGPIEICGGDLRLVLNVGDVDPGRSWVEVEVLDAERGEVLDGFDRKECSDVCEDAIRVPVAWKAKSLADVGASRIRLRFFLYGAARLYSYGFENL